MSDKMPESMDEEAVARWLLTQGGGTYSTLARAVLAWCEARVREAVELTMRGAFAPLKGHIVHDYNIDGYVARVMGRKEVGRE